MSMTKKTRSRVADVDDPFERLPEHILQHILALLRSPKEAARTVVVSRTWHKAWYSHPIFDFDVSDFLPRGPESHTIYYEPDEQQEISDQFLDFVDKAMSRLHERRNTIPRFRVSVTLIEANHLSPLLDKWIGIALDCGAQELHLDLDLDDKYLVPAWVFSSGFIKTLSLIGRVLITPLGSINIANLSSLKFLKLCRTRLDEVMLQKLLQGCPLLEELELSFCKLLTQVVISGPNKLRRIALTGLLNRVEIEAPSLEEFLCYKIGRGTLLTQVILLDHCPRVKHLKLWNNPTTQDQFQGILYKLPLLESLGIELCETFKKIVISNPLLKKIEIKDCQELDDIEIGSAILSCFRYATRKMQLPFIKMLNPTAVSVCKAAFTNWDSTPPNLFVQLTNWFIQLRKFLIRSCPF